MAREDEGPEGNSAAIKESNKKMEVGEQEKKKREKKYESFFFFFF